MTEPKSLATGLLKGLPVSEGIAIGKVWVLESSWDEVVEEVISPEMVESEIKRYQHAFKEVAQQLVDCRDRVQREIGEDEAEIFKMHLAILKDKFFQTEISQSIEKKLRNPEFILKEGLKSYEERFQKIENEYFRERFDDIKDVATRVLRVLLQSEELKLPISEPSIIVAHSLTPSDTARIDRKYVLGFATEMGGQTSHASILARSMGLPAVVGVERLMKIASENKTIVVDGNAGIIYIDPPQRVIKGYQKRQKQFNAYWEKLAKEAKLESITTDGCPISLQANVSMTADVSMAARYNAEAIGLFRTELPFLIAGKLLGEEEQFQIYKTVVEAMGEKMVTIRTMDLGGDKFLPFLDLEQEQNPFLGWRSIRISLQEIDVFKTQLRAILRASHYGNVRLLFPMISSLEEIGEVQIVMDKTKDDLLREGIPFDETVQTGIMIEVPSTAILIDQFVKYTDFLSIGTNDLIQYTLAVDRNNEKVAGFYKPTNPAILRLIERCSSAAHQANKSISICGEMAGNPLYTSILLGLGLTQLSMSPLMLPEVKERVRAVAMTDCEKLAEEVLQLESTEDIDAILWEFHNKVNKKQSIPLIEKSKEISQN